MTEKQRQAWVDGAKHDLESGTTCIIAQFKMREYFGTVKELETRHAVEARVGGELERLEIGHCDGGQGGAGLCEVFLYVNTPTLAQGLETVKRVVLDMKLLPACKIAYPDNEAMVWRVFYPENCSEPFSFF